MSSRRSSQLDSGAVVLMVNGMTGSVRQTSMNDLRLDYGLRVLEPSAHEHPDSGQGSDSSPPSPRLPPGTNGNQDIDEAISPLQLTELESSGPPREGQSVPQTPWPEKDPVPGPHVKSNWRPGAWEWVGYAAGPQGPQTSKRPQLANNGLGTPEILAPTHGSPIYRTKQRDTNLAKMVNLLGIAVLLAFMMSGVAFAMMFVNFPLAWPGLTSSVGKDFVLASTTNSLRLQWDRVGGGNDAEGYSLYIQDMPLFSEVTRPPVDIGNPGTDLVNLSDLQMRSTYKVEIWAKPVGNITFSKLLYEGRYTTGAGETSLSINVSAVYPGPESPPYTVIVQSTRSSSPNGRLYKVPKALLGSSTVEYEATELEAGRPYRVEVWAVRADGEERLAYLFLAKTST